MKQKRTEELLELTDKQLDEICDSGKENTKALIRYLINEINTLKGELQELRDKISKDSHNSSKPPSTNGYKKLNTKKSKTKKKKRGGQKGHNGKTLKQVPDPDQIKIHEVNECSHCGGNLKSIKATSFEKRQVFDLPNEIKIIVTEHRGEETECPNCGKHNKAEFPPDVTHKAQYGVNLKSYAVYLSNYMLIPYDRLAELFEDLFHIPLSPGTLVNLNQRCSKLLETTEEEIKKEIIASEIAHFDETGINIGGTLHWIHCASTKKYTCYYPHQKRGTKAMEEMGILPFFRGIAVHDHWKSYFNYHCRHSLCNAHHLRELIFVYEEYEQKWAKKMIDFLLEVKNVTEGIRKKQLDLKIMTLFERKYRRILNEGLRINPLPEHTKQKKRGRKKKGKVRNLLERLKDYTKAVLAFMYNLDVPFDNNQGERDIRMLKVKQKISCLFRSYDGSISFCRIRGYISTSKKNALNVINSIKAIFNMNALLLIKSLQNS